MNEPAENEVEVVPFDIAEHDIAADIDGPDVQAELALLRDAINRVLGSLTEKQAQALHMRFGLNGARPRTLREVGCLLNVTRARAQAIEIRAIQIMRSRLPKREIESWIP